MERVDGLSHHATRIEDNSVDDRDKRKKPLTLLSKAFLFRRGLDETRTRDPLRDRQVF